MISLLGAGFGQTMLSILSYILYLIVAILVFAMLIFIHELGHYTFGKIFKFKINEFAIGFGKAIWQKKGKDGVLYAIRIVPLGGYCAFEGEDGESSVEGSFNSMAWWKRVIVLFGGVFFNFVSACIISIPLLATMGSGQTYIHSFNTVEDLPAVVQNYDENDPTKLHTNDVIMYVGTNLKYALPVSFASCRLDIRRAGGHAPQSPSLQASLKTGGPEALLLGGRASGPPHMMRAGTSPPHTDECAKKRGKARNDPGLPSPIYIIGV